MDPVLRLEIPERNSHGSADKHTAQSSIHILGRCIYSCQRIRGYDHDLSRRKEEGGEKPKRMPEGNMEIDEPSRDSVKKRVAYFYDAEVGNYHYGQGHPMKVA